MFISETLKELHIVDEDYLIGELTEKGWVEIQPFLLQRGYRLRPRYDPTWVPSWFQVPTGRKPPQPKEFEDSQFAGPWVLDAVRVCDGQKVVFKRVKTDTDEIPIAMYLSSDENRKDPRNHTVPILDVIMLPGTDEEALLVMPFLLTFDRLPFRFLGEFCEFALQMLESLEFMHEHNIAHRDAGPENLMMDATKVVPKGHHFRLWNSHDGVHEDNFEWNTRWLVRPVPYYIIDFGLSTRCASKKTRVLGRSAQDTSVPELSTTVPYNPFMVDVYHFGNVLKQCIKEYQGLDAFSGLARAMTHRKARERPTMASCVEMCKVIIAELGPRGLERRVWRTKPLVGKGISRLDKLAVKLFGQNPIH